MTTPPLAQVRLGLVQIFQPPLCKGCGLPVATSKRSLEAPTEAAAETGDRVSGGGVDNI